jgi:hypothetical protein
MMKTLITTGLIALSTSLSAQYTFFEPMGSFAIEVSLDNSAMKRLPMYRNAITSLTVVGDNIIGGTAANEGLTPFIFNASIAKKQMTGIIDLNQSIPGQRAVRTGFCKGRSNVLYGGTIANTNSNGDSRGGHLFSLSTTANGAGQVNDLGVPVPNEGVYTLLIDSKKNTLYGITYPGGKFFSYSISTKAVRVFDSLAPSKKEIQVADEYVIGPDDYLCKALVETPQGKIVGSLPVNRLFSFDPATGHARIVEDALPEVWGHRSLAKVESWAVSKDGKIYGGNAADGQLFELDPATLRTKNLGKPIMAPRLRSMTFARNGKLYGIAGFAPGYSHLFCYDANGSGFIDYGNPQFKMKAPGIEQGIDWRGFQLATIASSEDGKYIVMGEDEALSQLLIFPVDTK